MMATCKQCKKPGANVFVAGRRVQGTVAGVRRGKGSYYCQTCIDANAAAHKAYQAKCDAKLALEYAEAEKRIAAAHNPLIAD